MRFPQPRPLPATQVFWNPKSKPNSEERVGIGNVERRWYPTLFGWEKRKRIAYFISHHELSTLKKALSRSNSSSRSKGSNHRPDPVTLGIGFSVSPLATDDGKRDARFGV